MHIIIGFAIIFVLMAIFPRLFFSMILIGCLCIAGGYAYLNHTGYIEREFTPIAEQEVQVLPKVPLHVTEQDVCKYGDEANVCKGKMIFLEVTGIKPD